MSRESMTRIYPRRRIKSSEGNPIDSVVYGASDNHIVGPATGHGGAACRTDYLEFGKAAFRALVGSSDCSQVTKVQIGAAVHSPLPTGTSELVKSITSPTASRQRITGSEWAILSALGEPPGRRPAIINHGCSPHEALPSPPPRIRV